MSAQINNIQSHEAHYNKGLHHTDNKLDENCHNHHHHCKKEKQPEATTKVKVGVGFTTALGVLAGCAMAFKRGKLDPQTGIRTKFSINPKNIFKDVKNSGFAKLEYDWKNVLLISGSSITGGLVGGALFDKKENFKAKVREGVIQMLGNISTPLICVGGGMHLFEKKLEPELLKKLKIIDKKGLPDFKCKKAGLIKVLASATCLLAGIIGGNKVGNFLNEEIYNIRDDRNVKVADMSGHIDDACLATSLAFGESNVIGKIVSRIIPIALLVCGYSTGIMQEWSPEDKIARKVHPDKPQTL